MIYKIYKITNLLNKKSYIGITHRSIQERFLEHCKPSRKKVSALTSAIQKYGKENFHKEEKIQKNKLRKECRKKENR